MRRRPFLAAFAATVLGASIAHAQRASNTIPRVWNSDTVSLYASSSANASRRARGGRTTKQYLLHHGFPGRLSTAGNVAFPFPPPELSGGTAYRFNVYHIMQVDDLAPLFPVEIKDL